MKNIILIGFMASGKTAVGRELASAIDYQFIDTKSEMENKLNMPWREIISDVNSKIFKDNEKRVINDIHILNRKVIEVDSKFLQNAVNMRMLQHNGFFIWLKTDMEHLLKNAIHDEVVNNINRPLLSRYTQVGHFAQCRKYAAAYRLLVDYLPKYQDFANLTVDVRDKNVSLIVETIQRILQRKYILGTS